MAYVHEDDVRAGIRRLEEILKGFFAVPDCADLELEILDRFHGDLLVDSTVEVSSSNTRRRKILTYPRRPELGSCSYLAPLPSPAMREVMSSSSMRN